VPKGSELVVIESTGLTMSVKSRLAETSKVESVTDALKVKVPGLSGIPLSAPADDKVMFGGRPVPPDHKYGGEPPVATSAWL
jgi:hypothetical protein